MRENQLAQLVRRNTKATHKIPDCAVAVTPGLQDEEHPTSGAGHPGLAASCSVPC